MLKHYSHDGSTEIVCNKTDNSTKFMFYLGGDAYSAPAILISDGEVQKLYYLHRDYLGSILMLTDENGNIAERRNFDAMGQYHELLECRRGNYYTSGGHIVRQRLYRTRTFIECRTYQYECSLVRPCATPFLTTR